MTTQRHLFQNPTDELPGQRFLFDPDVYGPTETPWHQSPTIQAIVDDPGAIAERMKQSIRQHRRKQSAK